MMLLEFMFQDLPHFLGSGVLLLLLITGAESILSHIAQIVRNAKGKS